MGQWIAVELTAADIAEAEAEAATRQARATAARAGAYGASLDDQLLYHQRGCLLELAFARYRGKPKEWDRWRDDRKRGHDGDGWEQRAGSDPRHNLPISEKDACQWYVLGLTHDLPRIWLAGWISRADAWSLRERPPVQFHRHPWIVRQHHLAPLPEKNGYAYYGRTLVNMETRFYDPACNGMHPLIEHRICRAIGNN